MKVAAAILSGALALSAAEATDGKVLTIIDVIARHEVLDGHIVRVRGWLVERCYRFGCSISAMHDRDSPALSLGGSDSFDLSVTKANAQGHEVLVEGRVKRTCFDHSKESGAGTRDIIVCTDRADELVDPRLIKIFRSRNK